MVAACLVMPTRGHVVEQRFTCGWKEKESGGHGQRQRDRDRASTGLESHLCCKGMSSSDHFL